MKNVFLAAIGVALIGFSQTQAQTPKLPGPLKESKKGFWSINVSYPTFRTKTLTAAKANRVTTARANSVFSNFVTKAKREVPPLKKDGMAAEYALEITPTVTLDSASLCSGFISGYIYTGGAHGTSYVEAINILPDGSKLKLQDLFDKYTEGRLEASKAILEQLLASGEGAWVQEGEWKELTEIQAENFVVTPTGLMFLFGSYELGSYAEGTFKVTVPFKQLQGLNRSGALANLLKVTPPSLYGSNWVLESVSFNDDTVLKPESGSQYVLRFEPSGVVRGIAGTNPISGKFSLTGQRIKIGGLASTRMADPPGSIAPRYLKSLTESTSFLFDQGRLVLQLPFDSGVIIFRSGNSKR